MRLLHIADWHLGRVTYNTPRAEDHAGARAETAAIAREFRPHLIIHSGDVWDGIRPGYPDLHRGIAALQELGALAPTVVICGNHDAPSLFDLFNRVAGAGSRVRFVPHAL